MQWAACLTIGATDYNGNGSYLNNSPTSAFVHLLLTWVCRVNVGSRQEGEGLTEAVEQTI